MRKFFIGLISFYQKNISPLLPNACRFTPTCSQYAKDAIQVHGALKGLLLGIFRILRCNPFCRGGYDPVPEKGKWHLAVQPHDDENN